MELKPCPFCGGEVEIRTYRMAGNDGFSIISLNEIYCDSCRVSMMQPEASEAEAAAAWNTRHVETCHVERVDSHYLGGEGCDTYVYKFSCGHWIETLFEVRPDYCP